MRRAVALLLLVLCAALALACGGDDGGTSEPNALEVAPPEPPDAAACGSGQLTTTRRADSSLRPTPGTYRYRSRGTRATGKGAAREPLTSAITLTATGATRVDGLLCFRLQRRYTRTLGETATFAVRGPTLYLTELALQAGGQRTSIRPRPPMVALDQNEVEWNGSFGGETRGRYSARVIGRRTFTVGGTRHRAIGVEFSLTATGKVTGSERSVRWFALDRSLVLAERVRQTRRFGVDRSALAYGAQLLSPDPVPAG